MNAAEILQNMKLRFLLHPDKRYSFFSHLLYRLRITSAPERTQSMAVDGKNLFYNPPFVESMSREKLMGVLAHEVLHCALAHHARIGNRVPYLFNVACDLAINPLLIDSGFELPEVAIFPGKYPYDFIPSTSKLNAEEIYELLVKNSQKTPDAIAGQLGSESGDSEAEDLDDEQTADTADSLSDDPADLSAGLGDDGGPDTDSESSGGGETADAKEETEDLGSGLGSPGEGPRLKPSQTFDDNIGGCGSFHEPENASPSDLEEDIESWMVAAKQARDIVEQRAGTLPSKLKTLIDDLGKEVFSGWDMLRKYIAKNSKVDYDWSRPAKKYTGLNLYLPHLKGESLDRTYVWFDCSGSVSDKTLAYYASNLQNIMDMYPGEIVIGYHDTKVHHTEKWSRETGDLKLTAYGRGGTDHRCTFDFMNSQDDLPQMAIFFTDMETIFPDQEPDYPVVWACSNEKLPSWVSAPSWGEVIYIPNNG